MENKTSGIGFKIGTTAIIWGFATGMLAICIPIISMTGSGVILPLAVIVGTTISTIVVWLSSGRTLPKITEKDTNNPDSSS
ncbi:hypothetical protein [Synechococcus sp. PCC 7336]|uniref:hypothetical protein n=1 Tax=Synechococcus sp. PCC 7336 TaxID=195250 RepID=UPI0003664DE0|nr:hypothetical protein [Synechococcus sp. PCC 7336]